MTTEQMLPSGFLPGKNEILRYRENYNADPSFSLFTRIDSFDITSIVEASVMTFCRRYSAYTGVDDSSWWEPARNRFKLMQVSYNLEKNEFLRKENKFREEPSDRNYKNLRAAFSALIGKKICLEYLRSVSDSLSEEEHQAEQERKAEEDKAWQEKKARREKILGIAKEHPGFASELEYDDYYIEKYGLTDVDLVEIKEMAEEERKEYQKRANIPYDHVEKFDYREGYYSVPIIAEKLRRIRKKINLNQRKFAKLIGYKNANKYAKFEKGEADRLGWYEKKELIKNVCDGTGANPYWLEDDREETLYDVREEETASEVMDADRSFDCPMFAKNQVIRSWWVEKQKLMKKMEKMEKMEKIRSQC